MIKLATIVLLGIFVLSVLTVGRGSSVASSSSGTLTVVDKNYNQLFQPGDPGLNGTEGPEDFTMVSENLTIIFEDKTPHFKLFLNKGTSQSSFYKIIFASLNEITPEGQLVNFFRFEREQWTYSDILYNEEQGLLTLNFSATLNILTGAPPSSTEVPISIQTFMYLNTTEIPYGNDTVIVPSGSFKFAIELGAWPFASNSSRLTLAIHVISNLAAQMAYHSENGSLVVTDESNVSLLVDNPQYAILDGTQTDIQTSLRQVGGIQGNEQILEYEFPYYENNLFYDPIFSTFPQNLATLPSVIISNLLAGLKISKEGYLGILVVFTLVVVSTILVQRRRKS